MAPDVAGGPPPRRRRRPRWPALVFAGLLTVPLVEIAVIIAVGRAIGGWPTFLLLLLESLLGAWLVRREGSRAWQALQTALRTGQMPSRELADAALVLVGGTLLLTPGFVTDAVGFVFVLPFTRPLTRGLLESAVRRRLLGGVFWGPGGPPPGGPGGAGGGGRSRRGPDDDGGDVVEGEVI